MITDADLSNLSLKALDHLAEQPEGTQLLDAILIYELGTNDQTEGNWHATNSRASVNVGMLRLTLNALEQVDRDDD